MARVPSTSNTRNYEVSVSGLIAILAVFFRLRTCLRLGSVEEPARSFLQSLSANESRDVVGFFLEDFSRISFLTGFNQADLEVIEVIVVESGQLMSFSVQDRDLFRKEILGSIPESYRARVQEWQLGLDILLGLIISLRKLALYSFGSYRQNRRVNGRIYSRFFLALEELRKNGSPRQKSMASWFSALLFHSKERAYLQEVLHQSDATRRTEFISEHQTSKDIHGFAACLLQVAKQESVPGNSHAIENGAKIEELALAWLRSEESAAQGETKLEAVVMRENPAPPHNRRQGEGNEERVGDASTIAAQVLRGEKVGARQRTSQKASTAKRGPREWNRELGTVLAVVFVSLALLWTIPRNTFYLHVAWWDAALGASLCMLTVVLFDVFRTEGPCYSYSEITDQAIV